MDYLFLCCIRGYTISGELNVAARVLTFSGAYGCGPALLCEGSYEVCFMISFTRA